MKTIILNDNSSKSLYGFRSNVIKLAIKMKYNVVCICPDDGRINDIKKLGAKVEIVDLQRKGNSIFNDYKLYLEYKSIFKKHNTDLVINYSIKPNIYGALACAKLNIKSMCMITGAGYAFMNNSPTAIIARILYRYALPKASKVWFLNNADKNDFINGGYVKKQNAKLINGEGVDINKFKPSFKSHKPVVFAYVGRMLWDKGVGEFVDGVSQIDNAKGVLIGGIDNGNPSAILKQQIDEWVADEKIEYWGEQSDMTKAYNKISVVVLSSHREGLNMTLMEAMSCSLPIITSNVRGCADLVENERNGYICKVKDVNSLKQSMEKMIVSDMKKMGICGRAIIEKKYSNDMIDLEYKKLFDRYL